MSFILSANSGRALFYNFKDMNILLFHLLLLFHIYDDVFAAKSPSHAITLQEIDYCEGTDLKEYVTIENLKILPNHTTSGYIEILQDLPLKTSAKFQGFDQKDGAWVPSPLSVAQIDLCRFLEKDVWFVPIARMVLNIPERCPLSKRRLVFRSTMLLKRSPGVFSMGCFKGKLLMTNDKIPLVCLNIVVRISSYSDRHEHTCIKA